MICTVSRTVKLRTYACPLTGSRPLAFLSRERGLSRLTPNKSHVNAHATRRTVLRRLTRPVLKHGPRSLECARVKGLAKPQGETKVMLFVVVVIVVLFKTARATTTH